MSAPGPKRVDAGDPMQAVVELTRMVHAAIAEQHRGWIEHHEVTLRGVERLLGRSRTVEPASHE